MRKQSNVMRKESGIALVFLLLVLAGVFAIGLGAWYVSKSMKLPEPVFCTQEAKQGPDGGYVGRTGPKCEFAPCPNASTTIDISNWKTYRNDKYGFEVRYPADLDIEFIATTTPDQIAKFHIHDPKFDFTDKVGQEIRVEYDEVLFSIYPYTAESFAQ